MSPQEILDTIKVCDITEEARYTYIEYLPSVIPAVGKLTEYESLRCSTGTIAADEICKRRSKLTW
jgi:hypothetical protein